jgi:hypothetical protein
LWPILRDQLQPKLASIMLNESTNVCVGLQQRGRARDLERQVMNLALNVELVLSDGESKDFVYGCPWREVVVPGAALELHSDAYPLAAMQVQTSATLSAQHLVNSGRGNRFAVGVFNEDSECR